MRTVGADHFSTGPWAATGPLRLAGYTCLGCGARLKTWAAFRRHRAPGACAGLLARHGASATTLADAILARLADPTARLPQAALRGVEHLLRAEGLVA